jgi:hypothetical protein
MNLPFLPNEDMKMSFGRLLEKLHFPLPEARSFRPASGFFYRSRVLLLAVIEASAAASPDGPEPQMTV